MSGMLAKLFGGSHEELEGALKEHVGLKKRIDLSKNIMDTEFVAFDTELTGLDFKNDSIISIGAIKMRGGSIYPAETFHSLMRPDCNLKSDSVVVHEITHTDLDGACEPSDILEQFIEFIGDAVLVGHFVFIDTKFVSSAMKKLFGLKLQNPSLDTLSIHEWLYENDSEFTRHHKGMSTKTDLFSLARTYGIEIVKTHNAFYDAYLTAQLFQRFIPFLPGCGVRTVRDLIAIGKS
jgi:DNA polymerase-3 subunit epsilon